MSKKSFILSTVLSMMYIMSNANNVALIPQTGQTSTLPINPAPATSDGSLREGKAWSTNRFTLDTSGNCVIDSLTGLMWVKNLNTVNNGQPLNWSNSLSMANIGGWCGYNDWRIPNINEIRSLINYGYGSPADWLMHGSGNSASPACSGACFSNIGNYYWSSSSYASNSTSKAWIISMSQGFIGNDVKSNNNTYYLFPVRGGH